MRSEYNISQPEQLLFEYIGTGARQLTFIKHFRKSDRVD
jgi:hypothetical protein